LGYGEPVGECHGYLRGVPLPISGLAVRGNIRFAFWSELLHALEDATFSVAGPFTWNNFS